MVVDHSQHHLRTARTALNMSVAPIQYVVSWPSRSIAWFEDSFTEKQNLIKENEDLRAKQLLLQGRLQTLMNLHKQNQQLRALLESSPEQSKKLLVAQLLSVDPDPFIQQVVLNQGSNADVYVGQPVLDGNGVYGQIINVSPLTSRVLLISDNHSAIPVQDNRSGVRGVVQGQGDAANLILIDMPITADVKVGDLLVTSGLGQRFPAGYPVGIIKAISRNAGRAFAKITVTPSAHIYAGHLVLLIWPSKQSLLTTLPLPKDSHYA